MRLRQQLLTAADAYAAATGRTSATVSKLLFGSGNRLEGLRRGRGIMSDGAEDALEKLSDQWPEGVAWPDQVPRPAPAALRPPPADPATGAPLRRRIPKAPKRARKP